MGSISDKQSNRQQSNTYTVKQSNKKYCVSLERCLGSNKESLGKQVEFFVVAMQQSGSILIFLRCNKAAAYWLTTFGRHLKVDHWGPWFNSVLPWWLQTRVARIPGGYRLEGWWSSRWWQASGLVESPVVTDFRVGRVPGASSARMVQCFHGATISC